jgi:predicted AAA+ superfamily ATPase
MIRRSAFDTLLSAITENKLVLVSGCRQVGKTTLIRSAMDQLGLRALFIDAANQQQSEILDENQRESLVVSLSGYSHLVIQHCEHARTLQAIIEHVLDESLPCQLVLSCSFQPLIDDLLKDVIAFHNLEIVLNPLSFHEMSKHFSLPEMEKNLEKLLVYGQFPIVVAHPDQAEARLAELTEQLIASQFGVSHRVNKSEKLLHLLRVLAFNIGEPISYHEIGQQTDLDNETVERYIDLLERSRIIIRLRSFSTGARYEMRKSHVFYFWDNGVRNAMIQQFQPLYMRNDQLVLWRNWLIAERIKWNVANARNVEVYFWRTHTRQMIDYLEINEKGMVAYKTLWDKKRNVKMPPLFRQYYPGASAHTINRSTYWSFLTKK